MNDLTTINTIFLIISLLVSGYFAGLVGMPLGPIRIFFMLFFGVNALRVFGTNLAISFVMMIPTVWNNLKNQRIDFRTGILFTAAWKAVVLPLCMISFAEISSSLKFPEFLIIKFFFFF